MVASIGRITAGRGYDYLTRDVATSKHDYYTGRGEAPGVWAGRGSALLGLSGEVDPEDMAVLFGRFVVPSTAGGVRLPSGRWQPEQVLGRAVSTRVRADGTVAEPVSAFDVTFSPAKSVSLLWGLTTDPAIRRAVERAHEDAVAAGLEYLDRVAGHTRAGAGGVRKVAGEGFVIAQFRHRTARSTAPGERVGDPQLHSHCAILNRVRGVDGVWRTLDGRAVYRQAHAAGAVYGATLERLLTQRLGVSWQEPNRRVPMRDIAGIDQGLIDKFSTRRAAVLATYERLEIEWRRIHGRSPTEPERASMMDEATVRSRHRKTGGDVDLHQQWRAAVTPDQHAQITGLTATPAGVTSDGGRLPAGTGELGERIFAQLHEQRSLWTRAHVTGEVARHITEPTPEAIEFETERLIAMCVPLEVDDDPEYADLDAARYTSTTIRDAETRVLDAVRNEPATFTVDTVRDPRLGDDQVAAVDAICSDTGRVSAIIGPAGSGKTTMLRTVATSFERADREVLVLTLSAAAARIVTAETGLHADTIATWRVGGLDLPRNGLVLIDEASMIPTLVLDQLVRVAGIYHTRIALLGDYAQMGAPEAGGLLRDIAATPHAVELTAVRRFTNIWEADASLQLRARNPEVAATYAANDRITESTTDTVFDDAAAAWWNDHQAGASAIIVVDTAADAADVSTRCQRHLLVANQLGAHVADTHDGNRIHIGDQIQTRRNTHDIRTSDHRRVLNRDVWTITGCFADGSLQAQHTHRHAHVIIPPGYLARDVELAYATTIAGAQGRTVDRGHVAVTPRTTSASLYVGMTRGRHHNQAHVVVDSHDHTEFELGDLTPQQAFASATTRDPDGQLSAHTVRQRWEQTAQQRAVDRGADRHRRHVEQWWQHRLRSMPTRMQTAVANLDNDILRVLVTYTNDAQRNQTVSKAATTTDWRQPVAGELFLDKITNAPSQAAVAAHAGHQTRAVQIER